MIIMNTIISKKEYSFPDELWYKIKCYAINPNTKPFTVLDFEKQIKNIKSKPRTVRSETELRFLYEEILKIERYFINTKVPFYKNMDITQLENIQNELITKYKRIYTNRKYSSQCRQGSLALNYRKELDIIFDVLFYKNERLNSLKRKDR